MGNPHHTNLSKLTFRRATLQDLDAYLALRLGMLAELGMLPQEPQRTELVHANLRYFQEKIPLDAFLAWVVESAGESIAIGGLLLFERPPNGENMAGLEGYVMNMYTLPGWRSRGIATRLMQVIIEYMRSRRASRLWLHATRLGRPIYEGYGFTQVNQDLLPETNVEMELRL